ncbi:MAG: hypothetical protein OHK0039_14600 [Bacteroidia bacterium]
MNNTILLNLHLSCLLACALSLSAQPGSSAPLPWAVGINAGTGLVQGDVAPLLPGVAGGVFVQKGIYQVLDMRIDLLAGQFTGIDTDPSSSFRFNAALNGQNNPQHFYDSAMQVFHNYRMNFFQLTLVPKINLNRMVRDRGSEEWGLYVAPGLGFLFYRTDIDVFDDRTGTIYDYATIAAGDDARSALLSLLDGTYDTPAERDLLNSTQVGNFTLLTPLVLQAGFRYRLSETLALSLDLRYLFTADDLLDGQQWGPDDQLSAGTDKVFFGGLGFDYTFR